ncbi:DNA polymerase Y family protein [Pseudonocardia sp. K10HN5]|uniref:DNA polymerase Y family protein n=1 Tax=Pseudonocardia acidicola TaxID=2724939 RepID=A0ABX1SBZ9_9PSEU|nr:DNA polymerase Y family protein [Pseudonocardia acidicola]
MLAVWSPDWPVTAAALAEHVPAHRPAAVVAANRVLACSATARAQGVRRGLRRREAQARCPDLAVLARDADRDARLFEPVVSAVEELAPGVEVVRPGLVALAAQGPVGYFGGELQAAERLADQVAARTGVECQIGLADGLFAAVLAARRAVSVPPGATPEFLAPLGVDELDREPEVDRSELVSLLRQLGLRSLGAFGALEAADVASRFGADAVLAHRLARGLDPRPPVRRHPPEELAVEIELDPPVDRVDAAAFAARGLAERLHRVLAGHGLSCTRLGVAAWTAEGEELLRIWRCAEPLTPSGTVDRVRWQLDAWLTRGGSGAVVRLRLTPEETVTAGALQLGLWGEVGEAGERAGRALVRVQALLGPDAVVTAVLAGGRDPGERVLLVPWGDDRGAVASAAAPAGMPPSVPSGLSAGPSGPAVAPETVSPAPGFVPDPGRTPTPGPAGSATPEPGAAPSGSTITPGAARRGPATRRSRPVRGARAAIRDPVPVWPGRLPAPSPAIVPPEPLRAELLDVAGLPVVPIACDLLGAPPYRIAVDGGPFVTVVGWAGPWPLRQRWWVPGTGGGARLQVLLDDGVAFLLLGRTGGWWVMGIYD